MCHTDHWKNQQPNVSVYPCPWNSDSVMFHHPLQSLYSLENLLPLWRYCSLCIFIFIKYYYENSDFISATFMNRYQKKLWGSLRNFSNEIFTIATQQLAWRFNYTLYYIVFIILSLLVLLFSFHLLLLLLLCNIIHCKIFFVDSPASRANVQVNDKIIKVSDISVRMDARISYIPRVNFFVIIYLCWLIFTSNTPFSKLIMYYRNTQ